MGRGLARTQNARARTRIRGTPLATLVDVPAILDGRRGTAAAVTTAAAAAASADTAGMGATLEAVASSFRDGR